MPLMQLAIAVDQVANAVLGGWADETLSSRAWRLSGHNRAWALARRFIDALALALFRQREHCFEAYISERLRLHSPPEERTA